MTNFSTLKSFSSFKTRQMEIFCVEKWASLWCDCYFIFIKFGLSKIKIISKKNYSKDESKVAHLTWQSTVLSLFISPLMKKREWKGERTIQIRHQTILSNYNHPNFVTVHSCHRFTENGPRRNIAQLWILFSYITIRILRIFLQ